MMSKAYRCDRCGEFAEGRPPVEVDIDTMARQFGGDVVLSSGKSANWSREDTWVEFCPSCSVALIEWVDGYVAGSDETESDR